jgi:hypothetical protein
MFRFPAHGHELRTPGRIAVGSLIGSDPDRRMQ